MRKLGRHSHRLSIFWAHNLKGQRQYRLAGRGHQPCCPADWVPHCHCRRRGQHSRGKGLGRRSRLVGRRSPGAQLNRKVLA